jgi:hypothetical protein
MGSGFGFISTNGADGRMTYCRLIAINVRQLPTILTIHSGDSLTLKPTRSSAGLGGELLDLPDLLACDGATISILDLTPVKP